MRHFVLGIGYSVSDYEAVQSEWNSYGLTFDFVDSFPHAIQRFTCACKNYTCVAICADTLFPGCIELLSGIRPVPIIVLSPKCAIAQRAKHMQYGAMQYIIGTAESGHEEAHMQNNVQCYLDIPVEQKQRLTLVATRDFYFCQEYRTVKVKDHIIDLTAKEFDILALLVKNPRRVFTYEMIMELVWGEQYTYYDRKVINNHLASLRRKLKIDVSVPDYIVNVHGVGYKFEFDERITGEPLPLYQKSDIPLPKR